MANWINISSVEELDRLADQTDTSILFKHSTRCPVSAMAKRSVEYNWSVLPEGTAIYFIDLIAHRAVSNAIAEKWNVRHESPQVLLIKGGQCVYHASHEAIDLEELVKYL